MDMVSNLMVNGLKERSGRKGSSVSSSTDSLIMFLVQCGNLSRQGTNCKNELAIMHSDIMAGIAAIYGRAHFSKRA